MRAFVRLVLLGAPLLAACGRGGGSSPAAAAAAAAAPAPASAQWSAQLQPVGSPVSGTLSLRPTADRLQTRAAVALENSVVGLIHRWEIRPGACGDDAQPALGSPEAYGVLEVGNDGTATLETSLPFLVVSGRAYHANLLRSRSDGTVIACGALAAV